MHGSRGIGHEGKAAGKASRKQCLDVQVNNKKKKFSCPMIARSRYFVNEP